MSKMFQCNMFVISQEGISQARDSLRSYICTAKGAVRFLQEAEASLLPTLGPVRGCSERLRDSQQALVSLEEQLLSHFSQLQTCTPQHAYLSSQEVERLQGKVLSQLLVRLSILQGQAQLKLEDLHR